MVVFLLSLKTAMPVSFPEQVISSKTANTFKEFGIEILYIPTIWLNVPKGMLGDNVSA